MNTKGGRAKTLSIDSKRLLDWDFVLISIYEYYTREEDNENVEQNEGIIFGF